MLLMDFYFLFFWSIKVDEELEIKAYYAGHVLGAAMFQIKVGLESVVYTVSVTLPITYSQFYDVPAIDLIC